MSDKVCCVAGVGPGNGAAIARRFAAEGHHVALLARSRGFIDELAAEHDSLRAWSCDLSQPANVRESFAAVARELGPVGCLVYNAGSGRFVDVDGTTPEDFERDWRINALGLLVAAQAVIPAMRTAGRGQIIVIGAGAAWRGRAGTLPFAAAKAAQRSLAQSLARRLGADGIHVAYVVIDGVVDLPRTREAMPDKPAELFLDPRRIADSVYFLTTQHLSAWTFELDLRPDREQW